MKLIKVALTGMLPHQGPFVGVMNDTHEQISVKKIFCFNFKNATLTTIKVYLYSIGGKVSSFSLLEHIVCRV